MTIGGFFALLRTAGCTSDAQLPLNDHLVIRYGQRKTIWPGHDQNIEVGHLFIEKVKADLGITA